jgi:hypothetical protein
MIEFNLLRDLLSLDMTEEDRDISCDYPKMIKYFDDKESDGSTRYNCLLE